MREEIVHQGQAEEEGDTPEIQVTFSCAFHFIINYK
jgi:hypothetical protein